MKRKEINNLIDAARGKIKADIVFKKGMIFDLKMFHCPQFNSKSSLISE